MHVVRWKEATFFVAAQDQLALQQVAGSNEHGILTSILVHIGPRKMVAISSEADSHDTEEKQDFLTSDARAGLVRALWT
jgi:hypothetical protein